MYVPQLYFSQIDTADMDEMVFKKYKKGQAFTTLIDTVSIPGSSFVIEPVVLNDYSNFFIGNYHIVPPFFSNDVYDYDWVIEIPSAGTHDTISDIVPLFHETSDEGPQICYSQFKAFKHNGQLVTFAEYDSGNFKIYIQP